MGIAKNRQPSIQDRRQPHNRKGIRKCPCRGSGHRPASGSPKRTRKTASEPLPSPAEETEKTTGTSGSAYDSRTPRLGVTKERGRGINAALLISSHTRLRKGSDTYTRRENRENSKIPMTQHSGYHTVTRWRKRKKEKAKSTAQPLYLPRSR